MCPANSSLQATEAQNDLIKTKEELHMVMTVPPPPPPPPMFEAMDDNSDSEETASEENNSYHSAELHSEGFNNHRNEEDRLTEAQKNERVQKQLKVRTARSAEMIKSAPRTCKLVMTPGMIK